MVILVNTRSSFQFLLFWSTLQCNFWLEDEEFERCYVYEKYSTVCVQYDEVLK